VTEIAARKPGSPEGASAPAGADAEVPGLRWSWHDWDGLSRDALYDVLALRCRVFILEQGPYQDPDGLDPRSWHLLGRDTAGGLQAYLRVVGAGAKYAEPAIGRVIIAPEIRGRGFGRALMSEGLRSIALTLGEVPLRISAQAHLQRFYGDFGFAPVGQAYLEDGIPHVEMLRPAPETPR
jgi:ElaA protein